MIHTILLGQAYLRLPLQESVRNIIHTRSSRRRRRRQLDDNLPISNGEVERQSIDCVTLDHLIL
jgi:hypothetical protein